MTAKRILIVGSAAIPLIHFRGEFIKSLIKAGYEVYAGAPEMSEEISEELQKIGAVPLSYALQRTGLNPLKDIKSILGLKTLMRNHKIDLVFSYTIKPVIYSSIAARMLKIPAVSLITGLGFTFSASSTKAKMLQRITEVLYRFGIRKNKIIIFQNPDDRDLFLNRHIISQNQNTAIVDGSGVSLHNYPYRVNENSTKRIVFVLVARLIKEKGVDLFMDAAETLKTSFPEAEFHIIGQPDLLPSAIKLETLQDFHNRSIIVYHGPQDNVPEMLYKSDVFVLPSYYREGIPRSILEALSIGMPIITTDTPGCRQTIVDNENGYLIAPKDVSALTEAMRNLLEHPEQIKPMGIASRVLATEKYDVNIINRKLIELLDAIE
ncbi:MAG: glycosyltransferase family 1 protein [Flavobacteriaceae bacterium]|nr:MAG: glycosyltransferase family 1 protein [Flavobacteriaceae bacterium]